MPTLVQSRPRTGGSISAVCDNTEPDGTEEEYPPEFFEELDRRFEETARSVASGEIKPMTVAEFAAQHGIKFNG